MAKAFLGFADGKDLRPEANQICKLSESSISSDTQNVYSLLPLTVITSGNFPSGRHGAPARSRKNTEGGISALLQTTAQGQQQATAEGSRERRISPSWHCKGLCLRLCSQFALKQSNSRASTEYGRCCLGCLSM